MRTTLLSLVCLSVLGGNFAVAKKPGQEIVKAPSLTANGHRFALLYLGGGDLVKDPTSPYDALLKDEFDQLPSVNSAVLFTKKTGNDRRAYVCKTGEGDSLVVTMPQVIDGTITEIRERESEALDGAHDGNSPQLEHLERPAWRIICPGGPTGAVPTPPAATITPVP